jgi:hypothetical protein
MPAPSNDGAVLPRDPGVDASSVSRITIIWGPEEAEMNAIRIVAIALIIAGALGLAYGGFSYTKENHEAKIGPIDINVKEKQVVNIPMWAGIGAIVIGGVLLLRRD